MNIGILLAAGMSTRFNSEVPKQIHPLNGKLVLEHSIEAMNGILDKIVVVTNDKCNIGSIKADLVVLNNVGCRLQSIKIALEQIKQYSVENIIIHDAARPFVPKEYFIELLKASEAHQYSQYCLRLINGLVKQSGSSYSVVNRDEYLELCTPQLIEYQLFSNVFEKYIWTGTTPEIITLTETLGIKFKLIEGCHKYLRKITTIQDLDNS